MQTGIDRTRIEEMIKEIDKNILCNVTELQYAKHLHDFRGYSKNWYDERIRALKRWGKLKTYWLDWLEKN